MEGICFEGNLIADFLLFGGCRNGDCGFSC